MTEEQRVKLHVGRELYWEGHTNKKGQSEIVTVISIGRKWFTVRGKYREFKVDIETMREDGGGYSSMGTCYFSKEERLEEVAANEAWDKLRFEIPYKRPRGIDLKSITTARKMLNF